MNIFTAVKYCCILHGRVCVMRINLSRVVVRKPEFGICEHNDAVQLRGTRKDQRLCYFPTRIVQSLYFLNPKFQTSRHLPSLYCPVCVGPGRKPRRQVPSCRGSLACPLFSRQFKCLSVHYEPIVVGNSEIIQKTQRALLLT